MFNNFIKRLQCVTLKPKCKENSIVKSFNATERRMNIFQTVQQNLSHLGISHYNSIQNCSINERNMPITVMLCTLTAINLMYLCHVATTFNEYADSVYSCLLQLNTAIIFIGVIWRMRKLFNCLKQTEKITNESMWNEKGNDKKKSHLTRFVNFCRD